MAVVWVQCILRTDNIIVGLKKTCLLASSDGTYNSLTVGIHATSYSSYPSCLLWYGEDIFLQCWPFVLHNIKCSPWFYVYRWLQRVFVSDLEHAGLNGINQHVCVFTFTGDYRECLLVIWSTQDYTVLTSTSVYLRLQEITGSVCWWSGARRTTRY